MYDDPPKAARTYPAALAALTVLPGLLLCGFIGVAAWATRGRIELALYVPISLARFFASLGMPKNFSFAATCMAYPAMLIAAVIATFSTRVPVKLAAMAVMLLIFFSNVAGCRSMTHEFSTLSKADPLPASVKHPSVSPTQCTSIKPW